jgi:hypothetical protein
MEGDTYMIVDKIGKYRLIESISVRNLTTIATLPEGTVLDICSVDERNCHGLDRKLKLLDWVFWNLPGGTFMRGFVVVDQWHSMAETWAELSQPDHHRGDAAQIDRIWDFRAPKILDRDPGRSALQIGEVVLRIEDDDRLTVVHSRYDTSD